MSLFADGARFELFCTRIPLLVSWVGPAVEGLCKVWLIDLVCARLAGITWDEGFAPPSECMSTRTALGTETRLPSIGA